MKPCGHQNRDDRSGFCAACLTEQKFADAGVRELGFNLVAAPEMDRGTFALVNRAKLVPGALVELWGREMEGQLKAYGQTLERAHALLSTPALEEIVEQNRWKVVVLRNGVAEAITIESNVVRIVHDCGALLFENCGERKCELVRCFAAGTWLEYAPAEASPLKGEGT